MKMDLKKDNSQEQREQKLTSLFGLVGYCANVSDGVYLSHNITDAELLSGNNEANDITLRQNISGQLVCSVRKDIRKGEKISTCGE